MGTDKLWQKIGVDKVRGRRAEEGETKRGMFV
jgi:hypothetical protein